MLTLIRSIPFVVVIIIVSSCLYPYCQEVEYDPYYRFSDELIWNPDPDLITGLSFVKEVTSVDGSLSLKSPSRISIHNNKIYVFDTTVEKLLIFDLEGNYLGTPFEGDTRIVDHILSMSVANDGRVLLWSQRNYYIVDGSEIQQFQNTNMEPLAVWDGDRIFVPISLASRAKEGLFRIINPAAPDEEVFKGEALEKDLLQRMFGIGSLALIDSKIVFTGSQIANPLLIDLASGSFSEIPLNITPFIKRARFNRAGMEWVRKERGTLLMTMTGLHRIEADKGELFASVQSDLYAQIISFNVDGNIKSVYRGSSKLSAWGDFATTVVDGKRRFYFAQYHADDSGDYTGKLIILTESDQIPSEEEALVTRKMNHRRIKEQLEKSTQTQSFGDLTAKIIELYKSGNDQEELAETALKFAEENPTHNFAHAALRYAMGRDRDPNRARTALALANELVENITAENNRQNYAATIASLAAVVGDHESLEKAWEIAVSGDNIFQYVFISHLSAAYTAKHYNLLRTMVATVHAKIEQKGIATFLGSGMTGTVNNEARKLLFLLHSYAGAAESGLGNHLLALQYFEKAADNHVEENLGYIGDHFEIHEANSLAALGHYEEALAKLLPVTLFTEDEKKLLALEEIYLASGGKDFKAYLSEAEDRHIESVAKVRFHDYEGTSVRIGEKLGKLTLLTFWMPDT
jgi:tetratricopeptide (TPR) repeat protein